MTSSLHILQNHSVCRNMYFMAVSTIGSHNAFQNCFVLTPFPVVEVTNYSTSYCSSNAAALCAYANSSLLCTNVFNLLAIISCIFLSVFLSFCYMHSISYTLMYVLYTCTKFYEKEGRKWKHLSSHLKGMATRLEVLLIYITHIADKQILYSTCNMHVSEECTGTVPH